MFIVETLTLHTYFTNLCTSHSNHHWTPFTLFVFKFCWPLDCAVMWNNETLSARRNSSVVTYMYSRSMCHKHSSHHSDGQGDGCNLTDFPQSPWPQNQVDANGTNNIIADIGHIRPMSNAQCLVKTLALFCIAFESFCSVYEHYVKLHPFTFIVTYFPT